MAPGPIPDIDDLLQDNGQDATPAAFEQLYRPGENIFSDVSGVLVENGWSIFPQQRDGKRLPGMVDGQIIEWTTTHNLVNERPTPAALAEWNQWCPTLNVACVFGPASGNTFALDIDVTEPGMSEAIEEMVIQHLGETPLRRQGRAPKIALIYRHEADDPVPSISRHFEDRPGDGFEILGAGRLLTFYGIHHVTRRYFKWDIFHPANGLTPQDAPVVTSKAVEGLLHAIQERFPFAQATGMVAGADWTPDLSRGGSVAISGEWVERDGVIVDGREKYLTHLSFQVTVARANAILAEAARGDATLEVICAETAREVADIFAATALCNGRWRHSALYKTAYSKVTRVARQLREGKIQPGRPRRQAGAVSTHAAPASSTPVSSTPASSDVSPEASAAPRPRRTRMSLDDGGAVPVVQHVAGAGSAGLALSPSGNPEFSFLASERRQLKVDVVSQDPKANLEIPEDRSAIREDINVRLNDAISGFFDRVYAGLHAAVGIHRAGEDDAADRRRVEIVRAPTGAGKTSQTIRHIAEDPRTYQDQPTLDDDGNEVMERMPIVMLLPTYSNIAELRQRATLIGLDGTLDDAALRQAALDTGLIEESEVDIRLDDIRRDALGCNTPEGVGPLKTMVYSGKIRAGCEMGEVVKRAMEAGIGTQGFCMSSRKNENGEKETTYCAFFEGCQAQAQRAQIAQSHVVFMPHNFLSLQLPDELKRVRCVIADERIHHLFLHTATFPSSVLTMDRRLPRLRQEDIENDLAPEDLLERRNDACDVVLEAINTGECPGQKLYEMAGEHPGVPHWGLALVRAAARVCRSGLRRDTRIVPNMSLDDVEEICEQPLGSHLREELQMWEILDERIIALWRSELADTASRNAQEELALLAPYGVDPRETARHEELAEDLARYRRRRQARGRYDARIQPVVDNMPPAPSAQDRLPMPDAEPEQLIRISWRSSPNWADTPTMLLDASAAPEVISKIWNLPPERIIDHNVAEDVGRTLNVRIVGVVDRTYSNSSLTSTAGAQVGDDVRAAVNLSRVRNALSAVSGLYGDGRVVVGTSIRLRQLVNDAWEAPVNSDWCHYGAMRGLDCFKNHAAAVSIGRMEVPTRVIDGLAASLTYDDDEPEEPFDILGTGYADEERTTPLRLPDAPQLIRMRNGATVALDVPRFPGRWGRMMQAQYREEEILQFVGRLRPVYRAGRTPTWFALSSIIPEGLIVDELVSLDDLLTAESAGFWEASRSSGGIVSAEILRLAAPDLCPTQDAARGLMMAVGLDEAARSVTSRSGRGFAIMRWRQGTTMEWRTVFAMASLGEEEARSRLTGHVENLCLAPGVEPEIEVVDWPPVQQAIVRGADGVDEGIGTMAQRRLAEQERQEYLGMYLMDSGSTRVSLPGSAPLWQLPDTTMPPLTPRQLASLISIKHEDGPVKVRRAVENGDYASEEITDNVF